MPRPADRKQRRSGLPAGLARLRALQISKQPKTPNPDKPNDGHPQWKPSEQPNIPNRESNRRKDPDSPKCIEPRHMIDMIVDNVAQSNPWNPHAGGAGEMTRRKTCEKI